MRKQPLIASLSNRETPERSPRPSKWERARQAVRSAHADIVQKAIVPWNCGICGSEVDPQYKPTSAILCRQCKRIVCPRCVSTPAFATGDDPICGACHRASLHKGSIIEHTSGSSIPGFLRLLTTTWIVVPAMVLAMVVPIYSFIMSTYNGSLVALLLTTAGLALLLFLWLSRPRPR